jgi:hypothetical protein
MLPCVVITPILQLVLDIALWQIFLFSCKTPAVCGGVPESSAWRDRLLPGCPLNQAVGRPVADGAMAAGGQMGGRKWDEGLAIEVLYASGCGTEAG